MSTGTDPSRPEPDADGLQFDHAEFDHDQAAPALACATCKRPIGDSYYSLNQMIVCEDCRGAIERHFEGGSNLVRLLRAVVLGSAAALLGAAIYFVILWQFQTEAALVSILVGFLVGKAVRVGSRNRGGLPYQLMAVVLTYAAIGLAYTSSLIAHQIQQQAAEAKAKEQARAKEQAKPAPKPGEARPPAPPKEKEADEAPPEFNAAMLGQMMATLIGVTFIAPVLIARENPLSLLIIGFGLWQAWRFTRRARVVFAGPYRVGGAGPDPAAWGGSADA